MKLTIKQKAFADYYIELGNATEAAIKAGYSENYANAQSYKLLENVGIKIYIDERMKILEDERIAKADEVLKFLTAGMRGEIQEEVVSTKSDGAGGIEPIILSKQISAKEMTKCAELLGKRYRLFTDKVEADVNQVVIFAGEDELED
ncbi:MAG: terminase small subunit [Paraclostridium sp.]